MNTGRKSIISFNISYIKTIDFIIVIIFWLSSNFSFSQSSIYGSYSIIAIEEYIRKYKEGISKLMSKIQSKMGRNIKIKANITVKGMA